MVVYALFVNWEKVGLDGRRVSHSTSFRTQFALLNVKGNGAGGVGSVGFSAHQPTAPSGDRRLMIGKYYPANVTPELIDHLASSSS